MASIPRSSAVRRCVPTLPRYLHPHLILPAKGLSRYQPSNPRATKSLGRFPNRNRFISEYIMKKTGKHRTPKQVGSRLQQLRDTHQGKQRMFHHRPIFFPDFFLIYLVIVLQNLSNGSFNFEDGGEGGSSPTPSSDPAPGYEYQDTPRTVVAIEILPDGASSYSPHSSPSTTPTSSPLSSTFPASTFRQSQPRPISVIDPTVTFTSRSSMVAHSFFTVLRDGQIVHNETAEVNLHSTSVEAGPSDIDCTFYYTAPLVPGFWATICQDRREFSLLYGMGEFAGARLSETSALSTELRLLSRSRQVFNYPRHLSALWTGCGGIQHSRTGIPDPLG